MTINRGQILSIIIAVLGVWVAAGAQLTDLFGPGATKLIIAGSTLTMSTLAAVNVVLQSQGSQITAVQAMPGVDKIVVNEKANATLATMAVDQANDKIQTTPQAKLAVQATAAAAA